MHMEKEPCVHVQVCLCVHVHLCQGRDHRRKMSPLCDSAVEKGSESKQREE